MSPRSSVPSYTVGQIAQRLDAQIQGDATLTITGLGSLASAQAGQISHLSNPAYAEQLPGTAASAVLVTAHAADDCPGTALIVANPYLAFARVSQMFAPAQPQDAGVHPQAQVAASAQVDPAASVGAFAVVGEDTVLEAGATLYPHAVVGARCRLAEDVRIMSHATLYNDVHLGARSVVHSSAVVGSDGFGFTPDSQGHWVEIAQLGGVRIGCDVVIGAGTTIDCGAIDDTVIEDGVKIDNQVQIGHNCHIGAHTLMCGCVGIAGSTKIGRHCVFAGASGAGGDKPVEVCDGVMVSQSTVLTQSVDKPGTYSGSMLFNEHRLWKRNALRFGALDELFKRVKRLERG
ncbi:MAG: UDP-3-O-(3-hydroxymyristoyl)glucosamine N-acyltransferase [Pseudomonadota bacterium]